MGRGSDNSGSAPPGYVWDPVKNAWVPAPAPAGPPPPPEKNGWTGTGTPAGSSAGATRAGGSATPALGNPAGDDKIALDAAYKASHDLSLPIIGGNAKAGEPDTGTLVPREAPQVAAPAPISSEAIAVTTPTAVSAAAPVPIAAPVIGTTGIAPVERIGTTRVAPVVGAVARGVDAALIDRSQQGEFRTGQQGLVQQLEAAARGDAPSAAELQLRRATDDAVAEQSSQAGAVHGAQALFAARQAGRNVGQITQRAALDAALLRATEQATARGQLGGALTGAREQDIGLATKTAELKQGADTTTAEVGTRVYISNADRAAAAAMKDADLDAAVKTGNAAAVNEKQKREAELEAARKTTEAGLGVDVAKANQDEATKVALANAAGETSTNIVGATEANKVGLANAEADLRASMANADNETKVALANAGFTLQGRTIDDARNVAAVDNMLKAQAQFAATADQMERNRMAREQLAIAVANGDRDAILGIVTAVIGAGAAVGAAAATGKKSDRAAKKNIRRESDANIDSFLSALEAWNYRYKDEKDGKGRRSGPMAQELEKSLIGRSTVSKDAASGHKVVDTGALTLALAGAVARLAKQQRRGR